MVKLQLDLDALSECESPCSIYDFGGLRHYLIIDDKDKEDFLDEITKHYRELIEDLLEEWEE